MSKLFNFPSGVVALIGGFFGFMLGGWDTMVKTFTALCVLDYLTGVLKAIANRKLNSDMGLKGIVKKVFYFIVIALANIVGGYLGGKIPLREITIMFFISNEAISVLENAGEYIPIPPRLKQVILSLRDEAQGAPIPMQK